ncbi:MAG: hypothetical protein ACJA1E_000216 [Paracoccaceae bacterium]|jgi:hypothetical protein
MHFPDRKVMTLSGAVPVEVLHVRNLGDDAEKVRFRSVILPPYLRKAKSIETLAAFLGLNAARLSLTTSSRLKADWRD